MKMSRLSASLALFLLTTACSTWNAERDIDAGSTVAPATRPAPVTNASTAADGSVSTMPPDGIHITPADHEIHVLVAFFDHNAAQVSPDSHMEIRDALAGIPVSDVEWVAISGHADRSGPAAYNERLSRQRADIVKGEFLRAGLSEQIIEVTSHGEIEPFVVTDDGVPEPFNRRVEVVIETKGPVTDDDTTALD